ncbi:winged helix-turn-helix domain-containing protein [uncultured Tenacibaculum sp.]|uniref:winged helix-turn-helix domain-containing protein n=1 Tax=uncultured Tenacibaculum sp. TaxID=174713 RepID=UPI00260A4860|nr:winged helix-turn-helix domain-containing protein [uncultured Tenacibaculum sp.]
MSKRAIFYIGIFLISVQLISCKTNNEFTEKVRVSLRNVGHQLLLTNQDSTSLVLPIKELNKHKYQLTFQSNLQVSPDSLVAIVKRSFSQSELPVNYRIEVKKCLNEEVAYSYEMMQSEENAIVPCKGRVLPANCYFIDVQFLKKENKNQYFFYGFLLLISVLGFVVYQKKKRKTITDTASNNSLSLGRFTFYPEQNKLIKEAEEIPLSNKECELLTIFIDRPNEVIKRKELMKKVWEENGVVVGRSLDTYISKLRKKLKEDASIKITNIHGVGYKLEID